jgi:hypothetical protein
MVFPSSNLGYLAASAGGSTICFQFGHVELQQDPHLDTSIAWQILKSPAPSTPAIRAYADGAAPCLATHQMELPISVVGCQNRCSGLAT